MKILIVSSCLFLFTNIAFARSGSKSVGENCAYSNSRDIDNGKYNKLLAFLGTKRVSKQRRNRRRLRGTSTGKQ